MIGVPDWLIMGFRRMANCFSFDAFHLKRRDKMVKGITRSHNFEIKLINSKKQIA
jgi:hypothetical protein